MAFQSTRLSRASTFYQCHDSAAFEDFNPQGSHEPRRHIFRNCFRRELFQSTRLSRASTFTEQKASPVKGFQSTRLSRASTELNEDRIKGLVISIHKALTSLDEKFMLVYRYNYISIHKALTSLDSKNTQLSLYPCQIYIS